MRTTPNREGEYCLSTQKTEARRQNSKNTGMEVFIVKSRHIKALLLLVAFGIFTGIVFAAIPGRAETKPDL